MINVLHVRSTTGFYGAEKVLHNLLPEINRQSKEFQANLFVIEGEGTDSKRLADSLRDSSVQVNSSKSQKKIDLPLTKYLKTIIKNEPYNVIHTHDYKSLVHGLIATFGTDAKVVHHMHGGLNTTRAEKLYAKIEAFFINFVSAVFIVSRGIKLRFFSRPTLGVEFIPNGVELPFSDVTKTKDEQLKLLIVARVSQEKNHILAVETISELKKRHINVTLDVIGDGPLLDDVKQKASSLDLNEQIKFHGFVTNTEAFYQMADLLIICSSTEGLPMNLLEALSYKIPVVSTAVGEIPHILNEGDCGFIADDNAISFADKIELLINDQQRFETMRINAIMTIKEKFSIESQASLIMKKYRGIIEYYKPA
ncbi:MAG: glycosyltransferase [Cellvibrionaceae bacterium]